MSADAVDPDPSFDDEVIRDMDAAADGVGRTLVEPDQGWIADDEATVVASEAEGEVGALSAEELAINVISEDEAPGLTWGEGAGYLDESSVERPPGFGADTASSADP